MSVTADARCCRVYTLFTGYVRLFLVLLTLAGGACMRPGGSADRQRPFTVVMIPDTQEYSEKRPDLFKAQTNWIRDNRDRENIVFVTHVGDLVQNHSRKPEEWRVADEAMSILDGVVPYGVAIGNHDYDTDGGDRNGVATMYLQYFDPERRFTGRPWYGGASPNRLNSCHLFSAGGADFVVLHLELDAPDDALAWAKDILERHPNCQAIVSLHAYLRGDAGDHRLKKCESRKDGNSAQQIWEKLIRRHPKIIMVLCGHIASVEEYHGVSRNESGGDVLEMLADYQDRRNGGDGWLRLIRFLPADGEIRIQTYSPTLDRFETDAGSDFSISWKMAPRRE
ncbi:MAG: serine/threonine protein phosphatase [Phycisphaerae bacterium]